MSSRFCANIIDAHELSSLKTGMNWIEMQNNRKFQRIEKREQNCFYRYWEKKFQVVKLMRKLHIKYNCFLLSILYRVPIALDLRKRFVV